ncbi:MAG TPA: phosphodiester glycosidase family protein [Gammaproteobacteria bacterium]|nr:phosphodiester glycosidase family protein [Gammaproteobacteria bacterium]
MNRATFRTPALWLVAAALLYPPIAAHAAVRKSHPFVGVTLYQIVRDHPRPQVINLVDIDPDAPGIHFLITPSNGDPNGAAPGDPNLETTRETTLQFITDQHAQLGINGSFFTFVKHTLNTNNISLVMSDGHRVSRASARRGWIINLGANGHPQIRHVEPGEAAQPGSGLYNAIAGVGLLVQHGKNVAPTGTSFDDVHHPRTAVGVTAKGHLLLVTVDGRQPGFSEGMSLRELGKFFVAHGAVEALNLDGGGSTTMAIADPEPRIINFPSDPWSNGEPGRPRKVGVSLAVFATPNPNYVPLPQPRRPGAPKAQPVPDKLTILDDFESGAGHFASSPAASDTTRGLYVDPDASITRLTHTTAQTGDGSQKITLTADDSPKTRGLFVRYLSGHGRPDQNALLGDSGWVGFFLKTRDPGLTVRIAMDDGVSSGSNHSSGIDQSTARKVIADGQWHLYQWNLGDKREWSKFGGGNGALRGPNTTIDSILFEAKHVKSRQHFTLYLDTVAYNPNGELKTLTK